MELIIQIIQIKRFGVPSLPAELQVTRERPALLRRVVVWLIIVVAMDWTAVSWLNGDSFNQSLREAE